jgi:hypothetical protein
LNIFGLLAAIGLCSILTCSSCVNPFQPAFSQGEIASNTTVPFGGEQDSGSGSGSSGDNRRIVGNNFLGGKGDDGNDNAGGSENNINDNGDDGNDNAGGSENNINDNGKGSESYQVSPIKVLRTKIAPNVSKLAEGDVTPILSLDSSHLIGIQISMNLTGNRTQLVAAQLTAKGMEHAVDVNLTKQMDFHNGKYMYDATFSSPINGTNPFTGKPDNVNSITHLMLRNNEMRGILLNGTIGKATITNNNLP